MITRLIPKTNFRLVGIQYDGTNANQILEFTKGCGLCTCTHKILRINNSIAVVGDWIVKYDYETVGVISDKVRKLMYKE